MAYQNRPTVVDETEGKKAYCACGESANKPYCDGSHMSASHPGPCIIDIDKAGKVAICDCANSGNTPFCDGTHASLP